MEGINETSKKGDSSTDRKDDQQHETQDSQSQIARQRKLTEKGRRYHIEKLENRRNVLFHNLWDHTKTIQNSTDTKTIKLLHHKWLKIYQDFQHVHNEYCELLSKEDLEIYLKDWYNPRYEDICAFQTYLEELFASKMNLSQGSPEGQVVEEGIRPDDSISRISHKTKKSQSGSSTISAIRIKTVQEKAELEIKQKKLKEKQSLERQRSELKLREEELELQTAMDIVSAMK
ncbi:hypothetical protein SNE40_008472 [Patella caerulea]|uniref:Uncharacterized protein n=1 Tax=Patella caerulea TaxID=87958 RepID=A0AAN8PZ26_PATCE